MDSDGDVDVVSLLDGKCRVVANIDGRGLSFPRVVSTTLNGPHRRRGRR
jgi:hypothetical protein